MLVACPSQCGIVRLDLKQKERHRLLGHTHPGMGHGSNATDSYCVYKLLVLFLE